MRYNILQDRLSESFSHFKTNTAIKDGSRMITYDQLEKKSNSITHWLLKKGAKKESFVGVLVEDRIDLITAIIGTVKAGCVFVPLDPGYPVKRIEQMMKITNLQYVILDQINFQRLTVETRKRNQKIKYLSLEECDGKSSPPPMNGRYLPRDQIYIYFTSGTTGKPRAIVGKHEGLLHFINWEIDTFGIDETFRFSQFTNPGFDVFLRDIFVPLCAGAAICIPGSEVKTGADSLIRWLDEEKINLVHCIPSLFRHFNTSALKPHHFSDLKYILFAGEKVIPGELENWYDTFDARIQLVNLYGPTETTLAKLYYFIQPPDTRREIMPVGKPIKGARAFVLNEDLKLCKKFTTGEVYIRTPYRSYGYLNEPQLNSEKFIPNPYTNDPGDLLYKTGDLGRLLQDGNIELLGRVDRQVKLRGIRIELDEIENILHKHPLVKESVVIKREISGKNDFLSAVITGKAETGRDGQTHPELTAALKQYLGEQLPEHMIPANIHVVEKIPRNPNGKVDYEEILKLAETQEMEYIAPTNDIERKLAGIWSEVLGFKKIGVTNTFFDLGGNSLGVMTLIVKIHQTFNKRISLGEIFTYNTIKKQAELIGKGLEAEHMSIEPAEKKEYYPLSPGQLRIYTFQKMYEDSLVYNLAETYIFLEEPDKARLKEAFILLLKRHESLRTSFLTKGDEPVQKIWEYDEVAFDIEYHTTNKVAETDRVIQGFEKAFDLKKAPLIKVGLTYVKEGRYILMVNMHHIIADGTSQYILFQDFSELYSGKELPSLKFQYKDYSEWQKKYQIQENTKESLKKQEEYWAEKFAGKVPRLNLPTDFPRPALHGLEGDHVEFSIDKKETQGLQTIAKEQNATLFMTLLALYNILLSKLSRQEDIVVGVVVTGRNHANLEQVIGVFLNTLALRNYPAATMTFPEFLADLKEKTLTAFENQDYQFEDLVEMVGRNTDLSRFHVYDAGFALHTFLESQKKTTKPGESNLKLWELDYKRKRKIGEDLFLEAYPRENHLRFIFRYSTHLFKKETTERFAAYFKNIVTAVIENPWQRIKDIEIISKDEKNKIHTTLKESQDNIKVEFAI